MQWVFMCSLWLGATILASQPCVLLSELLPGNEHPYFSNIQPTVYASATEISAPAGGAPPQGQDHQLCRMFNPPLVVRGQRHEWWHLYQRDVYCLFSPCCGGSGLCQSRQLPAPQVTKSRRPSAARKRNLQRFHRVLLALFSSAFVTTLLVSCMLAFRLSLHSLGSLPLQLATTMHKRSLFSSEGYVVACVLPSALGHQCCSQQYLSSARSTGSCVHVPPASQHPHTPCCGL